MHSSGRAYGISDGVPMQHYVDSHLERIAQTLERIDGRVAALEAFKYKLLGAVAVIVVVGNYVAGNYL